MSNTQAQPDGDKTFKRLFKYIRKYKLLLFMAFVSMAVMALTESGFAAIMKPLTDVSFVDSDDKWVVWAPLLLGGIFILRAATAITSKLCLDMVTRNVIRQLREEMFVHLLKLPIGYFDRNSSGILISKFIFDVEQVASAANVSAMTFIKDGLTILGLLAWMVYLDWVLTSVLLVTVPFLAIIIKLVSIRFRKLSGRIQKSMGHVTEITEESIRSQRVIKIYGGEKYELNHFVAENNYNQRQQIKLSLTTVLNVNILQFLVGGCFSVIIFFSIKQGISAGTFVSFMFSMMMLLPSIQRFTTVNATIQRGITAAKSVFSLLDESAEKDNGIIEIKRAKGDIEIHIPAFCYEKHKGNVLENIELTIKAGQSIAFVGRSGSGKSTLINLLPRFYELQSGSIKIDGIETSEMTLESLRRQISIVSQEIVLFNDTIEKNIAYGSLSSSTREEIIDAARSAHALEFIENLPDGFNTVVGESGTLLSGGQRQRIAIARALLKNSPILILDEATSALDTQSERHIQEALNALMENRTTLVIAHRLSTIEHVDRIVVMDNGRIVETGNHRELLQKDGYYAELYNLQFNN